MNLKFLFIWLVSIIIIFISCDDTITNEEIDNVVIPDKNVSFGKYIQPLIYAKCASVEPCHGYGDNGQQGGVILTNWDTIIEYVVPGHPDEGPLVLIVEGTNVNHPAVPDIFKLNKNQKQGILTWIEEGAQKN
jgi:hypothetical protein